jgi:hypothetical protein
MQDRHDLHARLRSAPAVSVDVSPPEPEPSVTPEPLVFVALESDIEPTEPAVPAVLLPLVASHNLPCVNVDPSGVDWSWLSGWMALYWRVPLALVVTFLLIIASW